MQPKIPKELVEYTDTNSNVMDQILYLFIFPLHGESFLSQYLVWLS